MKRKKNLKRLLNLGVLDYTNLTPKVGELDMPFVACKGDVEIDYIANYAQPCTYHMTEKTAVAFFEYDLFFDGLYGLWNAIYYGVKELQDFYIERFRGVRFIIAPDYSKCGDIPEIENEYRQFKSRVVAIWLTMNTEAIVLPLASTADRRGLSYMLNGMEECEAVAFNAKGPLGNAEQMKVFKEAIEYTVNHLPKLRTIVVYSTSPDLEKVLSVFQYAIDAGITVQVPNNVLQTRNRLLGGENNDVSTR